MGKKDIFTSVVRVKGSDRFKVVPVKSSDEVDKELWIEMSKVVSRLYVSIPIITFAILILYPFKQYCYRLISKKYISCIYFI